VLRRLESEYTAQRRLHSEPWSCCETGRVAACSRATGNVASDDATRTDHGIITYGYTRQNDRAAANPYVLTDLDRAPKLGTRSANRWITGMVCRVYLGRRADLCSRPNSHRNDVENYAIEIDEDTWPDPDIVAVVAMKWRSDDRAVSDLRQSLPQQSESIAV
jgi:hypothetical protein